MNFTSPFQLKLYSDSVCRYLDVDLGSLLRVPLLEQGLDKMNQEEGPANLSQTVIL